MNLDYLISKYIDGELTQSEDALLRKLLKEDKFSKHQFDMSVELHLDLIEDRDSITVPTDLYVRTQEAVLMKILASAPEIMPITKLKKQRFSTQLYSLVAMIAFFIIVTVFTISDNNLKRIIEFSNTNNSQLSSIKQDDVNSNFSNQSIKKQTKVNKGKSNKLAEFSNISFNDNLNIIEDNNLRLHNQEIAETNIFNDINNNEFDEINNIKDNISINNNSKNYNLLEQFDNKLQNHSFENNVLTNNPLQNSLIISSELTSIQLTTFVSQDFARMGIATSSNNPIISMSQSLGYNINDKSSFGIEFGIIELQYDYTKEIPVNNSISTQNSFGVNSPLEGAQEPKIYIPVKLNHQQQTIWGMAFLDTKLFTYENFSLNGRLGLGATDDGPIGLSRILAKYRLFDYFILTIGAEGKIFMLKTPLLESTKSTISSYGFVYGVQFNL